MANCWHKPAEVLIDGLHVAGSKQTWSELFRDSAMYSPDGKTWHPCGREE
jgi:hypothetical protein